ncbi:RDD family protein [Nonomuraea sp. N2-4H]|uniref:RDD family protein n=1 Tax=Nonomuraea sp. N2-4H TaxID=3128898 RepID=UPI003873ABF4
MGASSRGAHLLRRSAAFLYFWLLYAFWDGQSLGKKLFGIRVAQKGDGRMGVGQAAVR